MGIQLKTVAQIAKMREANLIVADVLDTLEAAIAPGVSTWELNEVASRRLKHLRGESAFLGYRGYPAVLCTSVNSVVVHGIPRKDVVLEDGRHRLDRLRRLQGRLVRRLGPDHRGRQEGHAEAQALMDSTREALDLAIAQCAPGHRLGDIGWAIQSFVEAKGYSVVTQFVGHGIGREMHEAPHVPNYGERGKGGRLSAGMVIAIEPMINAGGPDVVIEDDGWTAVTKDGSLSAHFEHSVAITEEGPYVLSRAS